MDSFINFEYAIWHLTSVYGKFYYAHKKSLELLAHVYVTEDMRVQLQYYPINPGKIRSLCGREDDRRIFN